MALIPASAHAAMTSTTLTASMKVWKSLTASVTTALVLPTILTSNTTAIDSANGSQFTGGLPGTNAVINVTNGCLTGTCATLPVTLSMVTNPISMSNASNASASFNVTLAIVSGGNTNTQSLVAGNLNYTILGTTAAGAKQALDYQGTSVINVDYN